ncbi:MAG: ribosome maturation factor RimM [Elusimicrobiota bacterium]|nr:ribosome maturation factor RimM [Elusimicrobiota bacterium]
MSRLLKIGYIIKPHGIKGELCISHYPKYDQLKEGQKIFFEYSTNLFGPYTVSSTRKHKNFSIVKTHELNSLTEVENFSGYTVGIKVKNLPENSFWVEDIIGCEVFTTPGEKLGKVTQVLKTTANDVYVVNHPTACRRGVNKEEILIPAIKKIVKQVDIANKRIIIEKLDGLW